MSGLTLEKLYKAKEMLDKKEVPDTLRMFTIEYEGRLYILPEEKDLLPAKAYNIFFNPIGTEK